MYKMRWLVFLCLLGLPTLLWGSASYPFLIDSVYDGDTVKGKVEVWPGLVQKISVRINGIDTPEIKTKNRCEKALGLKAKQALIDFIGEKQVTISNVKLGKYASRVLADVSVGGKDVAAYMIKYGYARVYHGGKRQSWCMR